ncbi:MAG: HlyD family efflux transporter periplasmic adaptor subunit [Woeseiaceae bacterium]
MTYKFIMALLTLALLGACSASDQSNRVVGELASERIEIAAESNEPIVEIAATEGQAVTVGQVLVRQDATRATAHLAQAEAALGQQQARLDELVRGPRREQIAAARASVEGAAQELAFRNGELVRVREVHKKSLASTELLDAARAALDASKANDKVARARLEELLAGTTIEELRQAEQAVKQAAALRDAAAVDLDRQTLRSPVDGIADSRLFEIGERPGQGQPVMIVLGGKQPYARVYVPEDLRVRVSAGGKALIYVDGLTAPVDGRVRWVSSEAAFTPYFALTERDRGRLSYVAKVDISGDRERLPDGVPVEVEFLVDSGS